MKSYIQAGCCCPVRSDCTSLFVQIRLQIWKSMALERRHSVQQQQRPGREILRKLRRLWGTTPPSLVSTSSANTFPSLPSCSVSICEASSLEVSVCSGRCLKPSSLSQSFHDTVLLVVSSYLSCTTPISASVHLICFCALERAASSFSLHPLCHSRTLANHRLSLPISSTPSFAFLLQSATLSSNTFWTFNHLNIPKSINNQLVHIQGQIIGICLWTNTCKWNSNTWNGQNLLIVQ